MTHGEIWLIDFGSPKGSLPSKIRPAVIMQNDLLGITNLNTTVVIPFTSNLSRADNARYLLRDVQTARLYQQIRRAAPTRWFGYWLLANTSYPFDILTPSFA